MVSVVVGDSGGIIDGDTVGCPEGPACPASLTDTAATVPESSFSITTGCGVDAEDNAKVSKG
jgi:hypothetical protein